MTLSNRSLRFVGVAVAGAIILTATLVFGHGGSAAAGSDYLSRAKQAFAVFARDAAPEQTGIAARVMAMDQGGFGLDASTIREARSTSESQVHIVLGRNVVCMLSIEARKVGTSGACASLDSVADPSHPMISYDGLADGSNRVTGLFADGVGLVHVETAQGDIDAAVENNVLSISSKSAVRALRWTVPGGGEIRSPAPADG